MAFNFPSARCNVANVLKNVFVFFEQEGVFYDFKAIKIIKRTKKIFNLSYWAGLYDQNWRILYGLEQLLFSTLFWNLKFDLGPSHRLTWYIGGISEQLKSQILIDLMTLICRCVKLGQGMSNHLSQSVPRQLLGKRKKSFYVSNS